MGKYLKYVLKLGMKIGAPVIMRWEKKYRLKHLERDKTHAIIFIIGAPRTGSTLLYQLITNYLEVGYISNLIAKFYKTPLMGVLLHKLLFSKKMHNNFKSEFGSTKNGGGISPSECGEFWYQFLPRDHHYIEFNEINQSNKSIAKEALEKLVLGWRKPVVFKNLNAGQRLRFIKELAMNCKFIWIRRDPTDTVQSILAARKKLGVSQNELWSIKPKNFKQLEKYSEIEMVVHQVYSLEKQIYTDLRSLYNDSYITIEYADLCENTQENMEKIADFLSMPIKNGKKNEGIERLNESDFSKKTIMQEVNKFDWKAFKTN